MSSKKIKNINHRIAESDNMTIYLEDAKRERLLTREEEEELTRKVKEGDMEARATLIKSNLRFVITIAKQYRSSGLLLEDLIEEGNLGLIMAADRFEPDKGYHFISYAVYWIRQSILTAINEKSRLIRLPLNKATDLVDLERVIHQSYYKTGDIPDVNQLSEILKRDSKDLMSVMAANSDYVSLEKEFNFDGIKEKLANIIEDDREVGVEESLTNKELVEELKIAMEDLNDTERQIIRARYGIGEEKKTLKEVSKSHSCTKERIRQIEKKALRKMYSKRYNSLKDFLN